MKDIDRVLAEHGHIFTKVKFSFTIDTVTVSLFTKSTVSFIGSSHSSHYTFLYFGKFLLISILLMYYSLEYNIDVYFQKLSSVSSDTLLNQVGTTPSGSASQDHLPSSSLSQTAKSCVDAVSPCSFTLTPERSKEAHRVISDFDYSVETPKEALAEIALDVVTLKGEMMSDGTLVANLVLYDCILQDTRPGMLVKFIT